MRNTLLLSLTFASFATAACGGLAAAAPPKTNTLSSAEMKAGWKLLFDGKTTKGWRGFSKPEIAGWTVNDGILARTDKGGDIMTENEYSDFEFQTDWKIEEGGNSGIIYRAAETEKAPYLTGPEYQLLDDERHPDAKAGKDGNRISGSLYDVYAPAKKAAKPAGGWNTTRIVVSGNHVEHWLNGDKVVDAEIGSADWTARVGQSKWAKVATYASTKAGHIDLQDHGDKVEFRNIKIRDLTKAAKPAAKQPKP